MGNSANRDRRRQTTQDDRKKALELRNRGLAFAQIAEIMGFSGSHIYKLVQDAIDEIPRENAVQLRATELARLDRMLAGVYPKAVSGNEKAIETVLKIMVRRSRYLGLDAPTSVAVTSSAVTINVTPEVARAFAPPEEDVPMLADGTEAH
jgi:predicted DNA-binding transcriptional regulator AlpA